MSGRVAGFIGLFLLIGIPAFHNASAQANDRSRARSGNVSFVLNGRTVARETFEAQLRRLVRSDRPRISERIVNEDGSHGGHGKTYDARDPRSGERWLYMEVTLRNRSGGSRISRVLRRARR